MGASPQGFSGDLPTLGYTRGRHIGIPLQQEGRTICGPDKGSVGRGSRCSDNAVGSVFSCLCFSSNLTSATSGTQDSGGDCNSHLSGAQLAPQAVVLRDSEISSGRALAVASQTRPALSGSYIAPQFTFAEFDGMAIEATVLRDRGVSGPVLSTMVNARKLATRKIYHRVWKSYIAWCEAKKWHPRKYVIARILAFLQVGVDLKLALSTIKGQVSALSVYFQRPLASHSLIRTFIQGVTRLLPPISPPSCPWDLNLVLAVLQKQPFEPIREIPLVLLTRKLAFLFAITTARRVSELAALSCREPYLRVHQDKVVFRPVPSFLPKVVSAFHLNQDIILPSFFPQPSSPEERRLHTLDVVRVVKVYLEKSADIRKTDAFFVVPEGPKKGQAAARTAISLWIRQLITQAYNLKKKVPPFRVKAHSTRRVGTSWAFCQQTSVAQICRAATWSSVHTFTKFYQVDVRAAEDSAFGRSVLRAAV